VGKPRYAGFPWPEAPKAGLQAHPFQRKGEAMSAFGRRSPPPATLTYGRKNTEKKISPTFGAPFLRGSYFTKPLNSKLLLVRNFSYVFATYWRRCGGTRAFAEGKHCRVLPQEGVCMKTRVFRGLRPGGTALAVPPSEEFDLSPVPPPERLLKIATVYQSLLLPPVSA
jgi:hypothetical protein